MNNGICIVPIGYYFYEFPLQIMNNQIFMYLCQKIIMIGINTV